MTIQGRLLAFDAGKDLPLYLQDFKCDFQTAFAFITLKIQTTEFTLV